MNENFTSVTLFYAALKNVLLTDAGMTLARTLGDHDFILSGSGASVRLRRVAVSPTISAVGITLGSDLDVLEVSPEDPELCLPFNTTDGERFYASATWSAEKSMLSLLISPNYQNPVNEGALNSYRAEFNFAVSAAWVQHQDTPHQAFSPNFKLSGGPYIQAGV